MSPQARDSPRPERIASEDPDTAAARKELRQTAISEKPNLSTATAADPTSSSPAPEDSGAAETSTGRDATPDRDTRDDTAREQMASPKKKRLHEEVDETDDTSGNGGSGNTGGKASSTGGKDGASTTRTDGDEPERKRLRDTANDPAAAKSATASEKPTDKDGKSSGETKTSDKSKVTSSSAFLSSRMSSYATQESPFLKAGSSQASPFAAAASTSLPPGGSIFKSGGGGGGGLTGGAPSPFGGLSGASSPFGGLPSGGGGFGGLSSGTFGGVKGPALTSFAKPGASLAATKPAKAFGAPENESDEEDEDQGSGAEGGDDGDDTTKKSNDEANGATGPSETAKGTGAAVPGESKGPKLQRVPVEDGEENEATLLQIRARLYYLDKTDNSWKERGAGNMRINVPVECVELDETTKAPLPGSFDASELEGAQKKNARLIMRQDSTHRVILNTNLIPSLNFKEISGLKSNRIIFTAYEAEGAVSVQIKVSAANAKSFLNEVGKVQRELQQLA